MLFVILSSTLPRIGQVASPFLLGIFRLKKKKKPTDAFVVHFMRENSFLGYKCCPFQEMWITFVFLTCSLNDCILLFITPWVQSLLWSFSLEGFWQYF